MVAKTLRSVAWAAAASVLLVALALPGLAPAAATGAKGKSRAARSPGSLVQLAGSRGCVVDRSKLHDGCAAGRALKGPGPFMGSRAIALSPDGKSVYVASSGSDEVAIFRRNPKTGVLTQPRGAAGCVAAAKGASGCGPAIGLDGPNSVAISGDGRSVYVTARNSNSIAIFARNTKTGALTQLPAPFGCVAGLPLPGCASGRALVGPDVVVASADGRNVYVGSFFGNAVAVFGRDGASGALAQPAGTTGCIATATSGCATGLGLGAPEGMAISANGTSLYVASALSNAVAVLVRDPATGALAQAADGTGCIVDATLSGCTTGFELSGANAVALSPNGKNVYATSLFSNSVTTFGRASSGNLTQPTGPAGCLVYLRSVACSFGRAIVAPEGLAVAPDGKNVYVAAFATGAIDVLSRNRESGAVAQKPGAAGCLAPRSVPGCTRGRALRGVSSIAVSPDGRNVYSTSFGSNAVDVFRRVK
jgi:DNA-binding beta-propeller fold protein YncE